MQRTLRELEHSYSLLQMELSDVLNKCEITKDRPLSHSTCTNINVDKWLMILASKFVESLAYK
jgi:hypothetical protein